MLLGITPTLEVSWCLPILLTRITTPGMKYLTPTRPEMATSLDPAFR